VHCLLLAAASQGKQQQQTIQEMEAKLKTTNTSLQAVAEAAAAEVAAAAAAEPAPDRESVSNIVLIMLHGPGLANPAVWQQWLQQLPAHIKVVFHVCRNAIINSRSSSSTIIMEELEGLPNLDIIKDHLLYERYTAEWGKGSLVSATVKCCRNLMMRYPHTQHIMPASGTHLPLTLDPFAACVPGTSWVPRMLPTAECVQQWAELGLQKLPELDQVQVRRRGKG